MVRKNADGRDPCEAGIAANISSFIMDPMADEKRGRSAKSGRFVKQSTVKKNPSTTVNETVKKKKSK